jgi:hypothetical protein
MCADQQRSAYPHAEAVLIDAGLEGISPVG